VPASVMAATRKRAGASFRNSAEITPSYGMAILRGNLPSIQTLSANHTGPETGPKVVMDSVPKRPTGA